MHDLRIPRLTFFLLCLAATLGLRSPSSAQVEFAPPLMVPTGLGAALGQDTDGDGLPDALSFAANTGTGLFSGSRTRADAAPLSPNPSMEIVVGISDMRVTNRPGHILVTHSLGSCLGLVVFDPVARVGGLIHCLLPMARGPREGKPLNPCMYVNTGVPHMIKAMYAKGANRQRLIIKAAGCGRMVNVSNSFDTGAANLDALKKLLDHNELRLSGSDVGGSIPRTVRLYMDTGRVMVSSCGKSWEI